MNAPILKPASKSVNLSTTSVEHRTVSVKTTHVLDVLTSRVLEELGHSKDYLAPSCDLAPRRWEEHQDYNGRGSGWTLDKGAASPLDIKVIEALETLKEFFNETA